MRPRRSRINARERGELHYLQHGEPVTKNAWAWLPQIAEDGATSYHVRKQSKDGSFEGFVQKVRPRQDIPLLGSSNDALVADLAGQIAADFSDQVARLSRTSGAG